MAKQKQPPIDLLKENPTKISQLTKENMVAFLQDKPQKEKDAFVKIIQANSKEVERANGKKHMDYNMKAIREYFAKTYFKEALIDKKATEKVDPFLNPFGK